MFVFLFFQNGARRQNPRTLWRTSHMFWLIVRVSRLWRIIIDIDWMQNAVLQWPVTHPTPRKASRMKGDRKQKPKSRRPSRVALPLPWETLKTLVNVYCSFYLHILFVWYCNTNWFNVVCNTACSFYKNRPHFHNASNLLLKGIIVD